MLNRHVDNVPENGTGNMEKHRRFIQVEKYSSPYKNCKYIRTFFFLLLNSMLLVNTHNIIQVPTEFQCFVSIV